jgi:predicted Zn-dependent protease
MAIVKCRLFILCAISSILLIGCFKKSEDASKPAIVAIPFPQELENVDPLITQLLSNTALEIKKDRLRPHNWDKHAAALLANYYFEESIQTSEILIDRWPNYSNKSKYRQAIARWRLNQQTQAIAELTEVLDNEPSYASGWRLLSQWKLEMGDLEESALAIKKAIELNPDLIGAHAIHATLLLQNMNSKEVIALLEPKLNRDDTPPHIYFLASQAYRQLGNIEAMEQMNKKSMPVPNEWPDPWLSEIAILASGAKNVTRIGQQFLDRKEYKYAVHFLKQALEANPENSHVRGGLSLAFIEIGEMQSAQKVLESIPNIENATYSYWYVYGNFSEIKAKNGDPFWQRKSLECYKNYLKVADGTPELFERMSQISESIEEHALAQDYIIEGTQLLIDNNQLQGAKVYLSQAIMNLKQHEQLTLMLEELAATK